MSDTARDTQFQGFAHVLFMELVDNHSMALNWDKFFPDVELIIARRVYDLVTHAFEDAYSYCVEDYDVEDIIRLIKDMTELPKEQ